MPEKFLVTGASGFVGRYVVAELIQQGKEVIATSRRQLPGFEMLTGNVKYISFDLNNFDDDTDLYRFFGKPEKMIHLAWEGLPNYESRDHLELNLPAQEKFLANLLRHGLPSLTVGGTCMEYGMQEGELSEERNARPANAYAEAKNELRIYLENLKAELDFTLTWIRMFYLYGKGQNPKSLHSQLMAAIREGATEFDMSPGDQLRDFLPVEEMARLIVAIAKQEQVAGIINCCSGRPVTVEAFVKDILRKHEVEMKLNKGKYDYSKLEPRHFWGSTKKLETIIRNGSN